MARRSVAAAGGCLTVLIALVIAVTAGWLDGRSLDQRVAGASHQFVLSHHAVLSCARDMTRFGSPLTVDLIAMVVAIALVRRHRCRDAVLVVGVRLVTWALTDLMKAAVNRPRPHFATAFGQFAGSSFPSGHASGAVSVYIPLAAVVAASIRQRSWRTVVAVGAVTLCLLVGASRVLLGAHYLSDVIAGLALGGAVTALCWATAQHMFRGYSRVSLHSAQNDLA